MDNLSTKKWFWILQILGWGVFYLIYYVLTLWDKPMEGNDFWLYSLTYIVGFVITIGLRFVYRYFHDKIERLIWLPLVIVVGSVITTVLWSFIDFYISHFFWVHGKEELMRRLEFRAFIKHNAIYTILMTSWSGLYFGIKYALDWQNEKGYVKEAENMAQKAQMEMLRYQLNPHFLFNSLNSIRALVDENQSHAKEMITELSEFLRYSLLHKDVTYVSLENEIDAAKHYFAIEKKRFEEKLQINYDIEESVRKAKVLTFMLHPIVENAVKYGMKTSAMPLTINISARKSGYGLLLEVCNSGRWFDAESKDNTLKGTGTGLSNVQKRLSNAYQDNYRFEVITGSKICVRIEIQEDMLR